VSNWKENNLDVEDVIENWKKSLRDVQIVTVLMRRRITARDGLPL